MPELPEVETMRRGISPVIGGRIAEVLRPRCRKRPIAVTPELPAWRKRVVDRQIVGTGRLGKRVLVELDTGDRMIFEPRMTGLVLVSSPPTAEHLRFVLRLSGAAAPELMYWDRRGLGSVRLVSPSEFDSLLAAGRLGPDALAIDVDELRARLGRSRRAIKVALLDQRALAGVGNLYASEILHASRIHPARPCDRLNRSDWETIHAAMRDILERAIQYEGSTLSDGTYRNALNQSGGYQNHHRVYDKAKTTCKQCGQGEIVRIVQAQRATFFCPACQKGGRRVVRRAAVAG